MTVRYCLVPHSLQAHQFEVTLEVPQPDPAGQELCWPAWIPGSYLIRDFARQVLSLQAWSAGRALWVEKIDKQRWRVEPCEGALTVTCLIYAFDLSVRGAYLDGQRGFFNGTSVFPQVSGQTHQSCQVQIDRPLDPLAADWAVATTLTPAGRLDQGFGVYHAADYDELVDHPVEMGVFSRVGFEACGVPHELVVAGRHDADLSRMARDLQQICEAQIRFFGAPPPFTRYLFLLLAVGEGYGGLEHRASTALICSRRDLPLTHETAIKAGYRQFLGLASHEYFHAWNVKQIKPAAFASYDLQREGYTRLLWAFEGITSYYDDLFLLRAGLIEPQVYLDQLAQALTAVERTPGRHWQTLEESSFDAWTKFYRPDENSPNSQVSYYVKGAVAALCLDLTLRRATDGAKSLDTVMQALWQRHGQTFAATGQGVGEREWEALAQAVSGIELEAFFDQALRSTEALPVEGLLADFGVECQQRPATGSSDKGGWQNGTAEAGGGGSLGVRTLAEQGWLKLTHVLSGGAAERAGLAAGDLLVALDGLRVTPAGLEGVLAGLPAGRRVEGLAFRHEALLRVEIELDAQPVDTWGLRLTEAEAPPVLRQGWLGR